MQNIDFVIAGVAVLALVGSALGVMMYDQPELRRYDVTVSEEEGGPEDVWRDNLVGPGAEKSDTWSFDVENVTHITFSIRISSDGPARPNPTVVELTIQSPYNDSKTIELELDATQGADDDSDTLEFHPDEAPSSQTRVTATSREAALAEYASGTNATGDWSLSARITSGGGVADPLGLGLADETVQLEVSATYHYYVARAQLHLPDTRVV